jgi:sulfhydrogenase subunit beta (sulfur reductase)
MGKAGYLPKEKLTVLLESLCKHFQLFVPYQDGEVVLFQPFDPVKELYLKTPANLPPKAVIFPQSDTLFSFRYHKDPEDPKKVSVELADSHATTPTIIFGARPCDAKGFRIYDRVYLPADVQDPYYRERRELNTMVTLACLSASPGCFCTSVGGGPADKEGADLLMTALGSGYFFEAITERGEELLREPIFEGASGYEEQAVKAHQAVEEEVKKPFATVKGVPEKLLSLFDNDAFWVEEAAKCISCGACTFLCPTCYCFNITDEQVADSGERIRSWDACMFSHFTLEASGHNPRPGKHQRLKNRVGHKFSYYPLKYDNVIACCGCGRCIRYCPVSVDISEIVAHAQEYKDDKP